MLERSLVLALSVCKEVQDMEMLHQLKKDTALHQVKNQMQENRSQNIYQ